MKAFYTLHFIDIIREPITEYTEALPLVNYSTNDPTIMFIVPIEIIKGSETT